MSIAILSMQQICLHLIHTEYPSTSVIVNYSLRSLFNLIKHPCEGPLFVLGLCFSHHPFRGSTWTFCTRTIHTWTFRTWTFCTQPGTVHTQSITIFAMLLQMLHAMKVN